MMKKTALVLATVAAVGAASMTVQPAEARGGRGAAIGFGIAAGALAAGAVGAYAYGPGPYYGGRSYYGPRYYDGPRYGYYDSPRYYRHRHYGYY